MSKVISVSKIFIKSNVKKFTSSILSLASFLLIVNLLLGIILSTTGIFSDSLTDNNTMHFMEVIFDSANEGSIDEIKENLYKINKIESIVWDFCHPIMLNAVDSDANAILNIIGIPKEALKYFNITTDKSEYFFIPSRQKGSFSKGSEAVFEEGEYFINEEGNLDSKLVNHQVIIDDYYKEFDFDMLPPDLALIDEARMLAITERMYPDGKVHVHRILVTCDDISSMKDIETQISQIYPDATIRYSLKYSKELPTFSVMLITGSSIIIVILLIICIINIRNNVNQILDTRNRDIGLLTLLGTGDKYIKSIFIHEFSFYGFITFIIATLSNLILFVLFKMVLRLDLLTDYFLIYLILNLTISVLVFCLVSFLQISRRVKKLNKAKLFKEFLK